MNYILLGLAGALAVANWLAVARGWRTVEYITKPATLLALLAFVVAAGGLKAGLIWFVVGLAFSLAGDIFLMLPQDLFRLGLWTFLVAHIAYIIGFNPLPPFKAQHLLVALLITVLVALPASQIYRRLAAGLQAGGRSNLKGPTLAYTFALSLMLISALFTMLRGSWLPVSAVAVSAGALLFLLSDGLLVWNRFIAPLPAGRVWVRVTYHLAQILIALGATVQFIIGPVT